MTKRFVRRNDTVTLELGGGDRVFLKSRHTYGDSREIGTLLSSRSNPEKHVGEYLIRLLEIDVLGWEGPGFVDDDGTPVPVTRENLDALDEDVATQILTKINELNPVRGKEERQESPLGRRSSPLVMDTPSRSPDDSPSSESANGSDGAGTSSSERPTT